MTLIPNFITALNLVLGVTALRITLTDKNTIAACWLVLVCVLLDGLDGTVARWIKKESAFGKVFDSCADFVSFGIAPAFIFLNLENRQTPLMIFAALTYLFSSGYRLMRFHALNKSASPGSGDYFLGLPITASACFLVSAVLIFHGNVRAVHATPGMAILIVLSMLMISRVPFPRFDFLRSLMKNPDNG